jgi:mannose-6-phosphate isomerase-like protein (cupin superfamily)
MEKSAMSLSRKAHEIPVGTVDMGTTSFSTSLVHGVAASLMVATRPGGYHSQPHTHDCEQLNLLQDGELHVYCDGKAYFLQPGDMLRIPAGAVHWSWNRSELPCTLLEVHAPGLQDDPEIAPIALGLFDADEERRVAGSPVNENVALSAAEVARIEALNPSDEGDPACAR